MGRMLSYILTALIMSFAVTVNAAEVNGVFNVVKGDVKVKSGKSGDVTVAKIGSKIFPKDTIITGKDSRAKVVMVDKNVINVSPETQLVIQNYEFAPDENKKSVLLNVIYGKVRSKVEQKYDGEKNKFQVKTPAAVAGVRGTDFLAGYNQETKKSDVMTFEGKVEFGQMGAGGKIENPVLVGAGQMADASAGAPPSAPQDVPKDTLAKIDKESKAETATGGSNEPNSRQPAEDGEDKKEEKDSDKKDEAKKDERANKDEGEKSEERAENRQDKKEGRAENRQDGAEGRAEDRQDGGGSGSGGGAPVAGGGTGSGSNDGTLDGSAPAPAPTPTETLDPNRDPASTAPLVGGGSMLIQDDIAAPIGVTPIEPIPIYTPPPLPTSDLFQPCDVCRSVIEDGNTKLIIRITNGN